MSGVCLRSFISTALKHLMIPEKGTGDSHGSLPEKIPRAKPESATSLSLHRLQGEFLNFNLSTSSTNNSISIYCCKAEKQQDLRCSMETVTPQINQVFGVRLCWMLQAGTTAYRVWEHWILLSRGEEKERNFVLQASTKPPWTAIEVDETQSMWHAVLNRVAYE